MESIACPIEAAVPRTANMLLPTSPSTIRFANIGINKMQTENRMLATARRISADAPLSAPAKLPALVMAVMLLMLRAINNRQKIP
jgi:hypothetical protein